MPSRGAVHTELWTSWASLLRSYAAAHGMNAPQGAVVEVSADQITLRVGGEWFRCTASVVEGTRMPAQPFCLNDDGSVTVGDHPPEEMDFAAERFARQMLG